MKVVRSVLLTFVLLGIVFGLVGCATTEESENVSTRPWGYVRGYDPGLPSNLNEGR